MIIIELFKLFGSIFIDNDEANKSIKKTDDNAQGLGSTLGGMAKTAGAVGAAIGGAAIAGGAALLGLATKASDTASRVQDMSSKIGMSTQGFQEWDYLLSQVGVDVGVLQVGFKKFAGAIDDATAGGDKQKAMFAELGISLTDAGGKVKSTEVLFNEATIAFTGMEEGAHKTALASDLFGKSASEMGAILNGSAADITNAKDKANELGLVLSGEAIAAGDNFGDTMDNVKKSFGAIVTVIGVEVMPIIQKLMDWVIANMPTFKTIFESVFNAIGIVVKAVGNIFANEIIPILQSLLAWVQPYLPAIKQFFEDAFNAIITVVKSVIETIKQWYNDNKETLDGIKESFTSIFNSVIDIVKTFISYFMQFWNAYGQDILRVVKEAFDFIVTVFSTAFTLIADIFNVFAELFKGNWSGAWEGIKTLFFDVIEGIKNIFSGAFEYIKSVLTLYKDIISDIWSKVWGGIKETFLNIWDGIVTGIKNYINGIIGSINSFISLVTSAINAVTNLANKIPGVNIPTATVPKIPGLAEGGTVTRSGSVLVGENAPEILSLPRGASVTPLNKTGNIIINISGNTLMNDKDADALGDLLVRRLKALGVT